MIVYLFIAFSFQLLPEAVVNLCKMLLQRIYLFHYYACYCNWLKVIATVIEHSALLKYEWTFFRKTPFYGGATIFQENLCVGGGGVGVVRHGGTNDQIMPRKVESFTNTFPLI